MTAHPYFMPIFMPYSMPARKGESWPVSREWTCERGVQMHIQKSVDRVAGCSRDSCDLLHLFFLAPLVK